MALFDRPAIAFDDTRRHCGGRRIIAYGAVAGRVLVCVCIWRGTVEDPRSRIVSPRPANRGERHADHTVFRL